MTLCIGYIVAERVVIGEMIDDCAVRAVDTSVHIITLKLLQF